MAEPSEPKGESTSKPEGQGGGIPTHPLVTKLLGDTDPPRNLVVLVGYCGPSKKPDSVRLYLGLDFRAYYEIPRGGIIPTEPIDSQDENSPTKVVVEATTRLELVQVSRQSVEASFLQGGIASAYLGGTTEAQEPEGGPIQAGFAPVPKTSLCPSHHICPPTRVCTLPKTSLCPSHHICPVTWVCQPGVITLQLVGCPPTQVSPYGGTGCAG